MTTNDLLRKSVYLFPIAALCWFLYVIMYYLFPPEIFIRPASLLISALIAKVGNWSFVAGIAVWIYSKFAGIQCSDFERHIRFYGLLAFLLFWLIVTGPFWVFFVIIIF